MKNLRVGEYREGAPVSRTKEGTLVDIGVEQPALIRSRQLPIEKRVTVKVVAVEKRVEVELASHDEILEYWGYKVAIEKGSFEQILKSRSFGLTIATSKHGVPFADVAGEIAGKWEKADTILVAFGAPTQGLYEILRNEGLDLNEVVDFVVNTIPIQGTETVRTEEALIASLAILNMQFRF
jgi:predicted SPOUT superfamily RNA methylase MTH1